MKECIRIKIIRTIVREFYRTWQTMIKGYVMYSKPQDNGAPPTHCSYNPTLLPTIVTRRRFVVMADNPSRHPPKTYHLFPLVSVSYVFVDAFAYVFIDPLSSDLIPPIVTMLLFRIKQNRQNILSYRNNFR